MSIERTFWKVTRWARAARFWWFLALALAAGVASLFAPAEAWAQEYATCFPERTGGVCETREQAYAVARASANRRCNEWPAPYSCAGLKDAVLSGTPIDRVSFPHDRNYNGSFHSTISGHSWRWVENCPADQPWDDATEKCSTACSDRDPLGSHSARGSMTVCSEGCQYEQGQGVCIGSGTTAYCYAKSWHPTGNQCSAGDAVPNPHNPKNDTCRSTGGGWNECVKENGDHCVTGPAGTRMCWTPGETGTKNDGSGKEWANRQPEGNPTPPPPNIENPSQDTTTADKGGVGGEGVGGVFVIGGGSGTGNSGGQHNTGSGGSGNGAGSGEQGDGDGEHGAPGAVGGDLYEGSDKTVASVTAAFKTRIQAAPIASAASGFFSAPSGGGSCPIWTIPANEYLPAMTFDFFCMSQLQTLMNLAGWLILAIAGYKAFHIAIGD